MSILQLEILLAPISELSPCGHELLFSPEIDAILEARRADDETLQQGEWQIEIKRSDWPRVIELTQLLITKESKDLRFAIWLTEAVTQHYGAQGLAQGISLISGLFSRYWDTCYPSAHEDSEQRIGHLRWLLQQIPVWVTQFPLTDAHADALNYQSLQFLRAQERVASDEASSGQRLSSLEQIMGKSSRQWYQLTYQELQAIQDALLELERVTDTYLGIDGPSFTAAKDALLEVLSFVRRWSEKLGVGASTDVNKHRETNMTKPIIESAIKSGQSESVVANSLKVPETSLTINLDTQMQRAQALHQLREVAAFFRRTEPHSPVTYLAEKAADWGEMSLHEWLATVIKDGQTLQQMGELLGMTLDNKGDS